MAIPSKVPDSTAVASPSRAALGPDYPIVVHSHLRWNWVWQRPQQFLSRLARNHPVLFVEEPLMVDGLQKPQIQMREVHPNVTVLHTQIPASLGRHKADVENEHRRLVTAMLRGPLAQDFKQPVQWFYDPMAVSSFARRMDERAVVYDCMDELAQFAGAHPELVRRERELLALANVVFAGGPKLHRSKSRYNPNCHCYGCGVDVEHFAKANAEDTQVAADVAGLKGPVLGYFGVVDERLDYALLEALAVSKPDWHIVMVGPVTKVDPGNLPRRANLHWIGQRDYRDLPAYVKAFDVCLMPFALNKATEFINPTKALEYMSAARPVVSTPVEDVVLQYTGVVDVASSHGAFINACTRVIAGAPTQQIERGLALARENSWDNIVHRLESHINDVLASTDQGLTSGLARADSAQEAGVPMPGAPLPA